MLNTSEPISAYAYYSQFKQENSVENTKKRKKYNKNSPKNKKPKRNDQKIIPNAEKVMNDVETNIKAVETKEVIRTPEKKQKKIETKVNNVEFNIKAEKKQKKIEIKVNNEEFNIKAEKKQKKPEIKVNNEETNGKAGKITKAGIKTLEKKQKNVEKVNKLIPRRNPNFQKSSSGNFHIDNFNSMKSGENLLKWILHPLNINQFFKENWEKQPVIIQRNSPKYFSNLLSCEDIDKALRKQNMYFTKNIDITSYSNNKRETHNPSGRATAPLVWDFYSNGCSIRILNPQTFFPKIHALNSTLQEYFECFVGGNVYLTPADSQGFAPHYDDIEAFVIQLEGEKLWKIYAPRTYEEILPRFSSGNLTDSNLGTPIQEVLLKAGDLLYFPRGYIHQGLALENKHSLHITLSAYQKHSWADLLETLLPAALKTAIEEDVSFRQGLPLHSLSNLGLVHSDRNLEFRKGFFSKVKSLITKLGDFAPVDAAVDQLGKKYIHDCLPPFVTSEEKGFTVLGDGETIKNGVVSNRAEMCLGTRIKLLRYNCIRMIQEEDSIRIYHSVSNSKEYHAEDAQFLEIDEQLAPAVEALILTYPQFISVEDLPIDDDMAKLQLASDLWENGVIQTQEPLSYLSD